MIWLDEVIQKYWKGKDIFQEINFLTGDIFRHQKNRTTLRFILGEESYFIKIHRRMDYKEIIKNFLQGRLPIVSAKNEFNAIRALDKLNVLAPTIVGYGVKGFYPLNIQSFIITKELTGTISLEHYCHEWDKNPLKPSLKYFLIDKIAEITKTLHDNKMHHRDLYICHFLFDIHHLKLFLIDMHRTIQYKRYLPKSRRISDLVKLYFSILMHKPSKRDVLRFIKKYTNQPLRNCLKDSIWKKIEISTQKLQKKLSG